MKTKILTALFIIFTSLSTMAQPLPPTTPSGSPVPVGALAGLVLAAGALFFINKKEK